VTFGLTSLVAFIVAIGILVSVHELGHFLVARRLGFKVLRFSIGFGRPLWRRAGRPPDRTEFVIAAIPLGGYVRMLDEREGPVPPEDASRSFQSRPPLARIAVLLAGPAANLLFAAAAYWLLFVVGVPGLKPVVGPVAPGSYAATAGLRTEDELLRVGETVATTRQSAILAILDQVVESGEVSLRVRGVDGADRDLWLRVPDAGRRGLTEPGELLPGLGFSFWFPAQPVLVAAIEPGSPAGRAGLAPGDEVVVMDGRPVAEFREFVSYIQGRAGSSVELVVERGGVGRTVLVEPEPYTEGGRTIGRIGLSVAGRIEFPDHMLVEERHGPFAALGPALAETWQKSAMTVRFLWRMVTGDVSPRNISGPINIAQYAGLTANEGFIYYLGFLALVSISLAILNLLPVPVLDGGQVLFQLVELARGGPLSMEAQVVGQRLGIAMLVALMGFAFYNDITRLVG
jgi:regulator of sigma E protease